VEVADLVRTFDVRKGKGPGGKQGGRSGGKGAGAASKVPFTALDGISMTVERGEVRGLLGPNGAGKTTLVKILSTVLLPTSGRASVFGHDVVRETAWVREQIGVVFGGDRGHYGRLTARRNLLYWAALYRLNGEAGRRRVAELLEQFGLTEFADTPVDRMSRGMKQRVHLARGFLSHPALLFLDEPTMGMDPVAAREFHRMFADLRSGDTTILLTTHDMAEAEQLCDQVTLIDKGRVLGTEQPREIGRWITAYERVEARVGDERLIAAVRDAPSVTSVEAMQDGWVRISTECQEAVSAVLRLIVHEGITELRVSKPSLQEVYLELIGKRGMKV
jgi:ABC-2 type transport system ATP-binding protein